MWYMGVMVKLLGLLLIIYFLAFSQVGDFGGQMIPLDAFKQRGNHI